MEAPSVGGRGDAAEETRDAQLAPASIQPTSSLLSSSNSAEISRRLPLRSKSHLITSVAGSICGLSHVLLLVYFALDVWLVTHAKECVYGVIEDDKTFVKFLAYVPE